MLRFSGKQAHRRMKRKHPRLFHLTDVLLILAFMIYVLLDTFVIPRSYTKVTADTEASAAAEPTDAAVTSNSYTDENISITITETTVNDSQVYVADVTLSDISYLKTAFASSTYGKNITDTTSNIAESVNAILAINGDYYGARNSGYVVRNGTVYRTDSAGSDQEDLVIKSDGSFEIITEGSFSSSSLSDSDILQVLSFGPGLISNGEITVSENEEVDQAKTSNPRTAIAEISPLHYLLVTADGRTSASKGLTLYQFAEYLQTLGAVTAYNLDGGGSTTMVFNGTVVNQPTTNGKTIQERSVSDIVYIGY